MDQFAELIYQIADADPETVSYDFLKNIKRKFAKKHALPEVPSNIQLLRTYHDLIKDKHIQPNLVIEGLLRKRAIRSQSGIVSVQVLTKPFRCPGKCIFCPNDFTMPKSYINTEPGAMRALLNNFDPIKQVYNRLLSLTLTGHHTDKIEMIVLGGTRDVYPDEYKEQFVKNLYDACNTFPTFFQQVQSNPDLSKKYSYAIPDVQDLSLPADILQSQKINETAQNRIIGLTVETRPEYVTDANCQFRRKLGITRLEMGVQNLYDDVLEKNKRGHTVQQAREAVHKLRQYGFKFSLHIMPGLYGSDYDKDIGSFRQLYDDPFFRPDEIKFYPTSVIPNTELYDLYLKGEYKPLDTEIIQKLIREVFLDIIPPYTRIKRLIRDIPATEIVAGSNITNLSQLTHAQIKKKIKDTPEMQTLYKRIYNDYILYTDVAQRLGSNPVQQEQTVIIGQQPDLEEYRNFVCLDTRSREIRNKRESKGGLPKLLKKDEKQIANCVIRQYRSSAGREYFITFEDEKGYLYGLTRLLLPDAEYAIDTIPGLGRQTALIRELHVYGQLASLQKTAGTETQHKGFGSQLMAIAEQISQYYNYTTLSVIAGVGVKEYYRKLGYQDLGTYVAKDLDVAKKS